MISSVLSGKKVLIVDDSDDMRKVMMVEFKRRGCTVFEATSGNAAMELIRTQELDVILSDICMPNGSGIELLEQIRVLFPKKPIVFLISGFSHMTEQLVHSKGGDALLAKPVDRKKMIHLLEEALEEKP